MPTKLSAVILAQNEQDHIVDCIEALSFCDEVIVIDDSSSDNTALLAKRSHATVIEHPLAGDFSAQRNYGLSKASGDWVLFIDADERVSDILAEEIKSTITASQIQGFFVQRVDFMRGKKLIYGETGNIRLLRLAKKNAGKWEGKVHEIWKVKGRTKTLEYPLFHYPHPTISLFLEEINKYSSLRAEELFEKKTKVSAWQIMVFPTGKFLKNYIVKRGFLDGTPGIVIALMMSFHSFLVRAKLWQLQKR